jgi:hypothetical protein
MDRKKSVTLTKEEFKKSQYYGDKDCSYWISQGKPIVWIEEYNKDGVQGYSDIGYGCLKLVIDGQESVSYNGNCVVFKNYVLLSPYYGDEYEGKVFKMMN